MLDLQGLLGLGGVQNLLLQVSHRHDSHQHMHLQPVSIHTHVQQVSSSVMAEFVTWPPKPMPLGSEAKLWPQYWKF